MPSFEWLDPLLLLYRDHRGVPAWPLVPYRVDLDGPDLRLTLVNGGVATGRASAWKTLAGRYWAQTFSPKDRALYGAWLPTLRDWSQACGFDDLVRDERVLAALVEASRCLSEAGQDHEALLCFAQAEKHSMPTRIRADCLTKGARERFERPRAFEAAYEAEFERHRGRLTIPQYVRFAEPWLRHDDPLERVEAAYAFAHAMHLGSYNKWLHFEPELRFVLSVTRDAVPFLSELGFGMVEYVAWKLVSEGIYAEALRHLDPLIEAGVGLSLYLAQRWECHLALGNEAQAAADWQRLAKLHLPWKMPPEALLSRLDEARDRDLLRAAGLSRVAIANLRWAERRDPYVRRRITKAFLRELMPPETHMARARAQADEAEALLPSRLASLPPAASGLGTDGIFLALAYVHAHIGEVRELDGDATRALACYEAAGELVRQSGRTTNTLTGAAIERLRGRPTVT